MRTPPTLSTLFAGIIGLGVFSASSRAATTIDFNDGTGGSDIGSFYSSVEVTFLNAEWYSGNGGATMHPESTGLRMVADGTNAQPKAANPIIVIFSSPMAQATLIANSVNLNGARIDAYDAIEAGNLVDFEQVFGASSTLNSNFVLDVQATGIRRLEIYQPSSVETEGVIFDNLTFTAVPEPTIGALTILGTGFLIFGRNRGKKA